MPQTKGPRIKPEDGNNLAVKRPDLAANFHPTLNSRGPETYTPCSRESVWWLCPVDKEHVWEAVLNHISRASKKTLGCPYCSHNKVASNTSLEHKYPDVAKEFDVVKNGMTAKEIPKHSRKRVWWICSLDSTHQWITSVGNRTGNKSGCPFCSGTNVTPDNNLEIKCPDLIKEFDMERNTLKAREYHPHSGLKVWWKCSKCSNKWDATVGSRTEGAGCPKCARKGYSKAQIAWLESLQREDLFIEHKLNGGERFILKVGKVDGYCAKTNTVYEYHGDFWHGHYSRLKPEDIHPISGKTFSQLFNETLSRDRLIISLGYKLVVQWETDYPEYQKLLRPQPKIRIIGRYNL